MRQENLLAHSTASAKIPGVPHNSRREFVKGLGALAGSSAFLGYDPYIANAEPPPETTKIRLIQVPAICPAPQYIAEELLRSEGFNEVEFVRPVRE